MNRRRQSLLEQSNPDRAFPEIVPGDDRIRETVNP
jgi:hypothetical protein